MKLRDLSPAASTAGSLAAVGFGCSGAIGIFFAIALGIAALRDLGVPLDLGDYTLPGGLTIGWTLWMVLLERLGRKFPPDAKTRNRPRRGPWIGVAVAALFLFHVEATARWGGPFFAFAWLIVFAWLLFRLAAVFDDSFRCSPEPIVRRTVRRNIAVTTLFCALTWAYWTPLPVYAFVWRHEDALRAACSSTESWRYSAHSEPPGFEGWATLSPRDEFGPEWSRCCAFEFQSLDDITIFYQPDTDRMDPTATRPRHLFGRWYFVTH